MQNNEELVKNLFYLINNTFKKELSKPNKDFIDNIKSLGVVSTNEARNYFLQNLIKKINA